MSVRCESDISLCVRESDMLCQLIVKCELLYAFNGDCVFPFLFCGYEYDDDEMGPSF